MSDHDADLRHRIPAQLDAAPLAVVGQLLDSSNAALLVAFDGIGDATAAGPGAIGHAIYKPIAGERSLWDFPDGHLAYREVAAWIVATAGGWDVIPPTVLREGPFGPGSVQQWVTAVPAEEDEVEDFSDGLDDADDDESGPAERARPGAARVYEVDTDGEHSERFVDIFDPGDLPAGWLPVLSGRLSTGGHVVVAHADRPDLQSVAVLDAVLNNSDRKGSHLLLGLDGRLWCIDHGLTLHAQDKLRTVLWGWAGRRIPPSDLDRVRRLRAGLEASTPLRDRLAALLTQREIAALVRRCDGLLTAGTHPHPNPDWPAVPWPAL